LIYLFYSFLSVLFICVFLTKNQVDKDEHLDFNSKRKKDCTKKTSKGSSVSTFLRIQLKEYL